MLNEVTEYLNYDCFNIGNHEFDWGQVNIANNEAHSSVPFLGANIVNYATKQSVDYLQPFTIVERNGVKVGIIGVIGPAQWTSITSKMVNDIEFASIEDVAKKYSDRLRDEFKCEVVALLNHSATEVGAASVAWALTKNSEKTGQKYVDAFFFGHDHTASAGSVRPTTIKAPYTNSGNNGHTLGHITLDIEDGKVKDMSGTSSVIYPDGTYSEDLGVKEIIDKYATSEVKAKAEEVVGSAVDGFSSDSEAPNLMAKSIYEYVKGNGTDVDMVFVNTGRATIPSGDVTYTLLSDVFPFFNKIVVMNANGSDIKSAARSGGYYMPTVLTIDPARNYRVATYDYEAYHMSLSRNYDYFHGFSVIKEYNKYPADILADYWKTFSTPLNANDYKGEHFTVK